MEGREGVEAAQKRYVEAGRVAAAEARKAGTPEYDHRAHDRAVEHERKAAEALAAAQAAAGIPAG